MKLTKDQIVQIFCAALNAQIQADAASKTAGVSTQSLTSSTVDKANQTAAEGVLKLESKAWREPE